MDPPSSDFDTHHIGLTIIFDATAGVPYLVVRLVDDDREAGLHLYVAARGCHELSIRSRNNAICLRQWSIADQEYQTWTELAFDTWEGTIEWSALDVIWQRMLLRLGANANNHYAEDLVIFHSTILVLKARNHLTVAIDPLEYEIQGEELLFQA